MHRLCWKCLFDRIFVVLATRTSGKRQDGLHQPRAESGLSADDDHGMCWNEEPVKTPIPTFVHHLVASSRDRKVGGNEGTQDCADVYNPCERMRSSRGFQDPKLTLYDHEMEFFHKRVKELCVRQLFAHLSA